MFLSSSFRLIFLSRRSSSLAVSSLTGICKKRLGVLHKLVFLFWGTICFFSIPQVTGQWFNYRNLSMSCLIPEIVFNAVWLSYQMQKGKNMAINEGIEGWWETIWILLHCRCLPSPCTAFFQAFQGCTLGKTEESPESRLPPLNDSYEKSKIF